MPALRRKIPPLQEILALYAAIVFLIYGWAIITFFWKVPSWLYFLTLGEIATILAYTFASSLLESTLILFVILLVGLILPSRWLFDNLIVRGSILIYVFTFWVALFNFDSLIELPTSSDVISFAILALLTVILGMIITDRISIVQRFLIALGNRLTIFLYIWIPLSMIGVLVILLRIL